MGVYKKGNYWKYDFRFNDERYQESGFESKSEAKRAEKERRQELREAGNDKIALLLKAIQPQAEIRDIPFQVLLDRRLEYVRMYNSDRHLTDHMYLAKDWKRLWGSFNCSQITKEMVEAHLAQRLKISPDAVNKTIRYLKALFNWGKDREYIDHSPLERIRFVPVEKRMKYVPTCGCH